MTARERIFFFSFFFFDDQLTPRDSVLCVATAMAATAEEQVIESVLVLFAMAAEAAPFVLHAGLTPAQGLLPSQLSCAVFTGVSHGVQLTVVTSGTDRVHGVDAVGTVPAALAAFAALQAFKPDLFVNAGTAGGFKALGGAVGDVRVPSTSCFQA